MNALYKNQQKIPYNHWLKNTGTIRNGMKTHTHNIKTGTYCLAVYPLPPCYIATICVAFAVFCFAAKIDKGTFAKELFIAFREPVIDPDITVSYT